MSESTNECEVCEDTGFYGDTEFTLPDGRKWKSQLVATLKPTALTANSGVYEVECRTNWIDGDYRGPLTEWKGHAVVAVANGKITVRLLLRNASGGTTGLLGSNMGSNMLRGNSFKVFESDGLNQQQLEGTLESGRLYGKWTDWRKSGARLEGNLYGKRQ